MKQIQYKTFGPPARVAQCVEVPDVGAPTAWEVVVDVEAFPINPADLAMLAGQYGKLPKLPSTIGMEAVGRVAQSGESVTDLADGDRVVILANDNWAERRKVPAAAVHKVSGEGDPTRFAMLKVNPATAMLILRDFVELKRGDWIIQTAPLSAVGRCVMQIAKARGIRSVNIVRRPEARAEVAAVGGDCAIEVDGNLASSVREAVSGAPIRMAIDAVGGPEVSLLAECLSEGGCIVNYGMLSGEPIEIAPEQTIFRGIRVEGFWVSRVLNRLSLQERHELFSSLADLVESGSLKMPVDSTYRMDQIGEALARAEQGGRTGKVLISLGGGD